MVMAHESIEWQMLQLLHKAGEKGMNLNVRAPNAALYTSSNPY